MQIFLFYRAIPNCSAFGGRNITPKQTVETLEMIEGRAGNRKLGGNSLCFGDSEQEG